MPKYPKDRKVAIWQLGKRVVNNEGVPVTTKPSKVGEIWANVRGENYKEYFAAGATWDKPRYVITVSKPDFEITQSHYVKFGGVVYNITAIDTLEDKPRGDMKLYVEWDRDHQNDFND